MSNAKELVSKLRRRAAILKSQTDSDTLHEAANLIEALEADLRSFRKVATELQIRFNAAEDKLNQIAIAHDQWGREGNHFEAFKAIRTILNKRAV